MDYFLNQLGSKLVDEKTVAQKQKKKSKFRLPPLNFG
jgi:hypothetical protein